VVASFVAKDAPQDDGNGEVGDRRGG